MSDDFAQRGQSGSRVEQPHEAWPIIEHEPEHEPDVPPDLSSTHVQPERGVSADRIREITRMSKARLREHVETWARKHGRRWVLGGPSEWGHDELVTAVVRVEKGREP